MQDSTPQTIKLSIILQKGSEMSDSIVSSVAKIHKNVKIGHYCKVYNNVIIESDCIVEDFTTLGYPSKLGNGSPLIIRRGSLIRSYSLFYESSEFGRNLVTGHRVTIRENTNAGENFQIGTLCDIQGHCRIGNNVRTHSNVFISQKSIISDFCWLFPHVVLTNDPHPPSDGCIIGCKLEEYSTLAACACILPGIIIGAGSLVAAGALVTKDVLPGRLVGGVPAKDLGPVDMVKMRNDRSIPAYPWRKHFHRGYPEEIVKKWITEFETNTKNSSENPL